MDGLYIASAGALKSGESKALQNSVYRVLRVLSQGRNYHFFYSCNVMAFLNFIGAVNFLTVGVTV